MDQKLSQMMANDVEQDTPIVEPSAVTRVPLSDSLLTLMMESERERR